MKKVFASVVALFLLFFFLYVHTLTEKNRTPSSSAENYSQSAFQNKNKLMKIIQMEILFTDSSVCIIKVSGISTESDPISYTLLLTKKGQQWKVVKQYDLHIKRDSFKDLLEV